MRYWDEFFGGPNLPSDKRMHITMSKLGNILLNARTYENLGQPEAAILLYDKRNSVIGVRPASVDVGHAFHFKRRPKLKHRVIQAIPFCRHHNIKVNRTIAFPEATIDPDGTLLLDMHTAIEIGR